MKKLSLAQINYSKRRKQASFSEGRRSRDSEVYSFYWSWNC